MIPRDQSVRWINPAAIARRYWNTTEADIQAAIAGRIIGVEKDGMVQITGHVWERPEDRPPLHPALQAQRDQHDARDHRVVRTLPQAAKLTGLPESTFIAAWLTGALRDDNGTVDLLFNTDREPLWRVSDIDLVTAMAQDGRLDQHLEDWLDAGGQIGFG
ncbi:hypothetical protein [Gordonia sp. KTR9]|uniref:hypothetical protein n=1 Tax=Gordonia sp. KTR9 TaxID=337191 RepID=UPI00027DE392|nr:hypothetical protein [Gordonia sp. KTR9]AFR51427.1 hypothetical protein KTR9_4968 [Gordonia sp. KTR9]